MPVVRLLDCIVDEIFRAESGNENWRLLERYGPPIARLKQNANIHELAGRNGTQDHRCGTKPEGAASAGESESSRTSACN